MTTVHYTVLAGNPVKKCFMLENVKMCY